MLTVKEALKLNNSEIQETLDNMTNAEVLQFYSAVVNIRKVPNTKELDRLYARVANESIDRARNKK